VPGLLLGAAHKKTPAVRGVCPVQTTFFGQGGASSDADVRTFLRKKLRIFWNL